MVPSPDQILTWRIEVSLIRLLISLAMSETARGSCCRKSLVTSGMTRLSAMIVVRYSASSRVASRATRRAM